MGLLIISHELTSAMLNATAKLKAQTPSQLQTMTGGPPDSAPMIKTPERALQQLTMLKEKPIILTRPKLRLSSVMKSAPLFWYEVVIQGQHTLLIAHLFERNIFFGYMIERYI